MINRLSATQKQLRYYIDLQSGLAIKEIATKHGVGKHAIYKALDRLYKKHKSLKIKKKIGHHGKRLNIDIQRDYIP